MKNKLLSYRSYFIIALIFLSCNLTSIHANIDRNKIEQNKDTEQQSINQTDTIVAGIDLFKTLKELTNSDVFKIATYTEYDWSSINIGKTDKSGCEIVKQKEDDFIVLSVWQMVGKEDTISFQILKETEEYTIYAYNENGITEAPYLEHSGFFVFKQNINGSWEILDLKIINSMGVEQANGRRIIKYYSYTPENKTLYIHKIESYEFAGETLHRAVKIEYKFAWSDIQEDFIYSTASDLPNPILIHGGGYTGISECANYYYAQIQTDYYHDNQLKNKDEIKFGIEYERANDNKRIDVEENTKNEVINNEDNKQLIWVKYKSEKILECEALSGKYETEINIIEDYEIIGQSSVVVTFTGYEMGDFEWYEFTTPLGYKYYFNENKSNKYTLYNEDADGPNTEFVGKTFKIDFHSELIDNEFGGGEFSLMVIDSIELINN